MTVQEFFVSIFRRIKKWTVQFYRWAWPYWLKVKLFVKPYYDKVITYFQTHPKARKAAYIFGPPFFLFVILLFVVWIETPWSSDLRNIRNQVASEVYSADSVLLGRYYIQDRTEVEYEDIAPAVFEALIATEDARFYQHEGVDYRSLGRVIIKSIIQQDESSGGDK